MNAVEINPGDNECFAMIQKNRDRDKVQQRQVVHQKVTKKEEITKQQMLLQLAHVLAPVMIGATWILGAMEGLADPVFTGVITGVCVLWAVVNYKWGNVNA